MGTRSRATLTAAAAVAVLTVLLTDSAAADVGVEKASTHTGRPGDEVRLTLGCGFCFPPCKGPKGERHPEGFDHGPCMLGTDEPVPESFAVSLVSKQRAERLVSCQIAGGSCPAPTGAPRGHGYRYLGRAVPPPGGNNPEHGDPPRYLLDFSIPSLPAGEYSYVIWCDVCLDGKAGSLIANPMSPRTRLEIGASRAE